MSITVSVVIPCYNVEPYVSEAVESALAQTHAVEQIICVDDGSTDGTLTVLRALEDLHPDRLTVLTGPNRGGNHARNAGLERVQSAFVQFLDADDVLEPGKIAGQVRLVESAPQPVQLVVGAFNYSETPSESSTYCPGTKADLVNLADTAMGRTSSNLWDRIAVQEAGGWNEAWSSSQEYELMFRMLSGGAKVLYDIEPLTWIRKRDGSLTHSKDLAYEVARFERIVLLRAMILKQAQSISCSAEEVEEIEQLLFGAIRMLSFRSLPEAVAAHRRYIKRGFAPSMRKFNGIYAVMYRALGFEGAERLRRRLKQLHRIAFLRS